MNTDILKYSLSNIAHRKMRSFLTSLSILIGVMAIYALISFGLGLQAYVDSVAEEAGVDKLFIQAKGVGAPGTDSSFALTQDDVDFVEKVRGVDEAVGVYLKAGEITLKGETKYRYMMGYDIAKEDFILESWGMEIEKGRTLRDGELESVVLGYNYQFPDKVFSRALSTGDTIELNGKEMKVVGFFSEIGNPQDDTNIYLTKEALEEFYPDSKDEYGFVMVRAEQGEPAQDVAERIEERLRKHKGQEEGKEDFFVQTFEDALATFNSIILILNGILYLIALISVVVAAVNIMNTMYTAVLERTKEIGIMKAIGARNKVILTIFILESGILGLLGGILGVALGFIVASTGGSIAASAGYALLKPVFPWQLTLGCLLFSFGVGAASGVLPARQASRLRPVDALRYE